MIDFIVHLFLQQTMGNESSLNSLLPNANPMFGKILVQKILSTMFLTNQILGFFKV